MKRSFRFLFALLMLLLAGCSITAASSTPESQPETTAITVLAPAPSATPALTLTASIVPATEVTEPYDDAVYLLDGVCFEFLWERAGQIWVWNNAADLAAFYNAVDESELCPDSVEWASFDFGEHVLVAGTQATQGCDAAYSVLAFTQDDQARTQTLWLVLDVQSGCSYELVQPYVWAIERPPAGYMIFVEYVGAR
ncbi:MAG: hypothetical protein GYB65_19230 [Chloroflexi bacterium]|nr:hypothetical protein [Chloroflexota bacterium]